MFVLQSHRIQSWLKKKPAKKYKLNARHSTTYLKNEKQKISEKEIKYSKRVNRIFIFQLNKNDFFYRYFYDVCYITIKSIQRNIEANVIPYVIQTISTYILIVQM